MRAEEMEGLRTVWQDETTWLSIPIRLVVVRPRAPNERAVRAQSHRVGGGSLVLARSRLVFAVLCLARPAERAGHAVAALGGLAVAPDSSPIIGSQTSRYSRLASKTSWPTSQKLCGRSCIGTSWLIVL